MGHSAESAFMLWATARNLLKRCGPQGRIWLSPVGYCAEFRLALWTTAQNQHRIRYESDPMYPHARARVSTCMWLYIYVHVAVYPRAHGHVTTWSCIHIHVAVYPRQNLAMCYGPQRRIWLCTVGHCTEFFKALWDTAQNLA